MYSLKVRANLIEQPSDSQGTSKNTGSAVAEPNTSSASRLPASADRDLHSTHGSGIDEIDQVTFSAGNPRVEHITGVVHLYRHIPGEEEEQQQEEQAQQPHRQQQQEGQQKKGLEQSISGNPSGQSSSSGQKTPAVDHSVSPFSSLSFPAGRNEQLCILALPADMGFAELCTFLGGYFPKVRDLRLVRREGSGSALCSVLIRFEEQASADDFYTHFNGKAFCLLEPEILCRLVFVKDVEFQSGENEKALRAPVGTTELPTCPVCLERLDEHISGIVTTVCNHRFHNECLRQWGDTSCPVCRYCQNSAGATTSHCSLCNTTSDLWICLICGHVGCGRYRGLHAATHWQESGHGYAMELETQRVWDYVNDSYVHRLIQSKTDGKLVEVPSPAVTGSGPCCSRPLSRGGAAQRGGGSCQSECGEDPEYDEALMISKLDALATEYNHLLVTQLESQRQFFEGQLVRQRQELDMEALEVQDRAAKAEAAAAASQAQVEESERRRRAAEGKLADTNARLQTAQKERSFLKQLNDTLLSNQKEYKAELERAQAAVQQRDDLVRELQEQVRDLMVFIEARQAIEGSGGGGRRGWGVWRGAPCCRYQSSRRGNSTARSVGRAGRGPGGGSLSEHGVDWRCSIWTGRKRRSAAMTKKHVRFHAKQLSG